MVYFLPAVGWALLIASLSTTSALPPIPWDFLSPDKIGHLVFYAILTGLLIWGMAQGQWSTKQFSKKMLLLAFGMASAYGAFLELVQASLPHRQFDYADMLANCLGALLCILIYQYRYANHS
jgi:VanZ family protein